MAERGGAAPTELGTRSIAALLRSYAVPGIVAMTASSLYNMVDSIFIGHIPGVGALAISGLAVTFPIMNLGAAVGTLVGVGASTMVSVLLGQRNYEGARKVLSNVVTLNTVLGFLFCAGILVFLDPILRFFGASADTLPFARDYMMVIMAGNIITHLYFGLNSLIRASGHPRTAMGLTLFTVTSNALLDPLFIYVFGLGIKGAALATVLCQTLALVYTFRFFLDKSRLLHFPKRVFDFDGRIARTSLSIGMGPFLMNCASCVVALFINQQLLRYGGDLAIGAYGIMNRICFFFIMIVMGFNQGMQPIAGYNYGARKYSRVRKVYLLTALCATVVTTLGFVVAEAFPGAAVRLFTDDPVLHGLAVHALRCGCLVLPLVGMQMVSTNFFQCLGMVRKSIFLSLSRQLLFLVPLLYTLPGLMGVEGVWYSLPLSDLVSFTVTLVMVLSLFRKFSRLDDGQEPAGLGSSLQ
ncbi:MAG: MATE family efflux transporter [Bacteroidales bacterium]|nr:MATE family efflux transporter [Bacteroidales bacterium]